MNMAKKIKMVKMDSRLLSHEKTPVFLSDPKTNDEGTESKH